MWCVHCHLWGYQELFLKKDVLAPHQDAISTVYYFGDLMCAQLKSNYQSRQWSWLLYFFVMSGQFVTKFMRFNQYTLSLFQKNIKCCSSFGSLYNTLLHSCTLWKLITTFLWFISFIKNNNSICVWKIWNINWSSNQFNAFWSQKNLSK